MEPLNIPAIDEDPQPFVREVSRLLAMASHSPTAAALKQPRFGIAGLTAGLDPDLVTATSPDFRFGAAEALGTVLGALAEQMVSDSIMDLLAKAHRARVLTNIAANEATPQRALAERLGVQPSNLSPYVQELARAGLIEPAHVPGQRGKAWSPTPWGWQTLRAVVAGKLAGLVPADELAVAMEAASAHLPMPEDTVEHTIAKDEVYRRIGAALSVETDKPLRLSTFYSGDLPAHHRPWELHKRVFERGDLARPVEWLFRDGEQTWLPALVQQAEGNPKVSVWSLNGPMEPTLTIQVLDTVGLQYPLRPNDCGLVQDREVALLAWDQIRQGADQLLKAGERVARAESHAA